MLYDTNSQDPPRRALIDALHETRWRVDANLKAREKFMRRMQRRYPQLEPGDPIPERNDSTRFDVPQDVRESREIFANEFPGIVHAVEHSRSLKEQEEILFGVIETYRDATAMQGMPAMEFSIMLGAIRYAIDGTEKHTDAPDSRLRVTRQRLGRYIDNASQSLCFLSDLCAAYQKEHKLELPYEAQTPYDLAYMLWSKAHGNTAPGEKDEVSVRNRAIELVQELNAPYAAALPGPASLDVMGIIGTTSTAIAKRLVANDHDRDPSQLFGLYPVQQQTVKILRDVFRKQPDMSGNPDVVLDAQAAVNNALLSLQRGGRA